jgi:hypothetical protein
LEDKDDEDQYKNIILKVDTPPEDRFRGKRLVDTVRFTSDMVVRTKVNTGTVSIDTGADKWVHF